MNSPLFEIDLAYLAKISGLSVTDNVTNDFFLMELDGSGKYGIPSEPCRFDGYMVFFCISGAFTLEINLKKYEIRKNMLVVNVPCNIWRVCDYDEAAAKDVKVYVVAVSKEFLSGLRFDINSLFDESLAVFDRPCFTLTEQEALISRNYFKLAENVLQMDNPGVRDSLQLLLSSNFHLIAFVWKERISEAKRISGRSSRSKQTFDDFILLVRKYHNEQRGVIWYADKLSLTPKYLSKLVKDVSGHSAPEWIDSFVITEAKNLLKYSDQPIKAIASNLGFSSPVAFHAFFKSRTGMTPLDYREK